MRAAVLFKSVLPMRIVIVTQANPAISEGKRTVNSFI